MIFRKSQPIAAITYFQPDEKKSGGRYAVAVGCVKKVDACARVIVMANGERIPIHQVISVQGELFRELDGRFA